MADAIMYKLPDGRYILHDPERVTLVASENGRVRFVDSENDLPIGDFRVGSSLLTYKVTNNEVTQAHALIELDYDEASSRGNH